MVVQLIKTHRLLHALPASQSSTIGEGNRCRKLHVFSSPHGYWHVKPKLIQKSLHTSKQCLSVTQTLRQHFPGLIGMQPFPLPTTGLPSTRCKLIWDMKWKKSCTRHCMIPVTEVSSQSKLLLMVLFTACSGEENGGKRRLGALVNAPRSSLHEVEGRGIVNTPIAKF
jgi:hypothetical protein